MGKKEPGAWPIDTEPSWTDETLPLELRRTLLDRALDRIKTNRAQGLGHPGSQDRPEHPGESGSEASGHQD